MSLPYVLTEDAEEDIHQIDDYTLEHFGVEQAIRTNLKIEEAMVRLGENPGLGHEREDLTPRGRKLRFWTVLKRFVIVYRPDTTPVQIIRVLDGSRDIAAQLDHFP